MAITKRIIDLGKLGLIKVGWSFAGSIYGFPFDEENEPYKAMHNKFRITVYGKDGRKFKTFMWYDSASSYDVGKETISDRELSTDILQHILKDCLDGLEFSFSDFCEELGWDTDSRRAERSYKACRRDGEKLLALGYSEEELRDIYNALSEAENDERTPGMVEA